MMRGWQSESTDTAGPKGVWSCVFFGMVAMVAVVTSPTTAGCRGSKMKKHCSTSKRVSIVELWKFDEVCIYNTI